MLKASFDVASWGTSTPWLELGPLPLVFAGPDLLTCFADLLALLCSSGWVLWDGTVLGERCPVPCCHPWLLPCLPSPSTCSCGSLTLFSILAASFFLLLNFCLALSSRKQDTTLTTSDHLNKIVFHFLPTKDYLNDSQMWNVSIKIPLFYKRKRH